MKHTQYRNCPCCGCDTVEVVATPRRVSYDGLPVASDYKVVSCKKCGFCYADTKATSADYAAYYTFFSKYVPVTKQPVFSARQKELYSMRLSGISTHCLSKEARIADFGCACGELLLALRERGFENLVGYDASPDCVGFVKSQGIEAYCYNLGDLLPLDAMFDVIILTAVLEHLVEPVQVLSVLKNHLKEDGLIFIEVPDATKFCCHVGALCYEFNIEHINYYSELTLSNVMKMAGFRVLDNQSSPVAVHPKFLLVSVVGKKSPLCQPELEYDGEISLLLKRYAAYSDVFLAGLLSRILEIMGDNEEICFWGAGVLLSAILGADKIDTSKIKCVVDSNPSYCNLSISSIPIVSPGNFFSMPCFSTLPIIISSIRVDRLIRKSIKTADDGRKIYSLI